MDLSQQEFYNTVSGETHYGKMRAYINMDHDFEDPDELVHYGEPVNAAAARFREILVTH